MKKVAYIITGLNHGGAELALLRLLRSAGTDESTVFVLTRNGSLKNRFEDAKIDVIELGVNLLTVLPSLFFVLRYLKRNNISVVCSWLYHADFFASLLKILRPSLRVFWTVHNLSVDKSSVKTSTGTVARVNGILSRFVPSKIVYCAKSAQDYHENEVGFYKKVGCVISNPILQDRDLELLDSHNELGPTFKIGMAARWDKVKNHELAFRALSELASRKLGRELRLELCGANIVSTNSELSAMLEKHGLTECTILRGLLSDVSQFYAGIDVLLITSHSEAFPNVVVEALVHETPVVSVKVGDIPKVLGHFDTLTSRAVSEIADKLEEVMNHHTSFLENIRNAKVGGRFLEFTDTNVRQMYQQLFNDV